MSTYWRDLDIRPAPSGWRAWFRSDHDAGSTWSTSLAGWLVQEETPSLEDYADAETDAGDRRRRVMPAIYVDVPPYLEAIGDSSGSLWMILGPGDPDPTDDERAAAIVAFRAERADARRSAERRAAEAGPAILAALGRLRRPADISTIALAACMGEGLTIRALSLLRDQGRVRRTEDRLDAPWEAIA